MMVGWLRDFASTILQEANPQARLASPKVSLGPGWCWTPPSFQGVESRTKHPSTSYATSFSLLIPDTGASLAHRRRARKSKMPPRQRGFPCTHTFFVEGDRRELHFGSSYAPSVVVGSVRSNHRRSIVVRLSVGLLDGSLTSLLDVAFSVVT